MTRTSAIRIHETGGPDVLRWEPIELPPPGPGEVRVRHTAIGLNFIDTYHRTGLYSVALPAVLGSEAAGVVEAVGEGVAAFAPGERVGYATGPLGSYAEARNIAASALVKIPADIDDQTAAATLLKGMTAHYLVEMGRLKERPQVVLVHAAAGGVGLLLCQWAKHFGATVIGTVGSEAKAELARANGCEHVIVHRREDSGRGSSPSVGNALREIPARVHELTNGGKVDVVYDSVGKDTFADSLASLRPRGLFVSFGQSSGPVPPFEPRVLAANGSLFFTRPTLHDYVRKAEERDTRARELFEAIRSKVLEVRVAQTYPLRETARAHRDLEARRTTGSTVLLP